VKKMNSHKRIEMPHSSDERREDKSAREEKGQGYSTRKVEKKGCPGG
jgi:hypothetical protein